MLLFFLLSWLPALDGARVSVGNASPSSLLGDIDAAPRGIASNALSLAPGDFELSVDFGFATQRIVNVALENYFKTNLQGLAHWEKVFEVVPAPNFGLNFDPSHLCWQQIDYIDAVYRYRDRIFHTHAKDTEIRDHDLRYLGNQAPGWWPYCIPGYGRIHWGQYIAALKSVGYDGVLCIEHEDNALGREEGFLKGLTHLRQFA